VLRERVCRGTGGTLSARYCYSVWLRHLVLAHQHGRDARVDSLAELGPGDSLGIGLAAVLSGVDRYLALDAKVHAARQANLAVLDELIALFRQRASIPGEDEFPHAQPKLVSYRFPNDLLTETALARALNAERLTAIRAALQGRPQGSVIRVDYLAPWQARTESVPASMAMVISQAVMEHVEDVAGTYQALYMLLRPGGFMSHNIDFRCHGLTRDWNGHWTIGAGTWALTKGTRPYLINRLPHSAHVAAIRRAGFRIVSDQRREGPAMRRQALASAFRDISDVDLATSGTWILAEKPITSGRSLA
jgi:hypothetical protein